ALYDVPAPRRGARVAEVLGQVGLDDRADQPVRVLSRGLTQRAAIARAIVHEPRVLLLDEPFTGLDLAAATQFRRLLAELGAGGRAVVLATHNVEEGAELASDLAFQVRGRFVWSGPRTQTTAEIAAAYRGAVTGG
ncbi:MAG: ATP-binding cassette domain-containing protein, partial [Nitrososphaera sp.]